MSVHEETHHLPYSSEQMYALVLDVEQYPEFVPGYVKVRIKRHEGAMLYVDQVVRFGALRFEFDSVARTEPPRHILIQPQNGPLANTHLEWRFAPVGSGCRVGFRVDYGLGGGVVDTVISHWFDHTSTRIVDAFIRRAHQLYGESG